MKHDGRRKWQFGLMYEARPEFDVLTNALDRVGTVPCQTDPDAWCADDEETRTIAAMACDYCPVKKQCAEFADANRERYHVWGGVDRTTTLNGKLQKGENYDNGETADGRRSRERMESARTPGERPQWTTGSTGTVRTAYRRVAG